MAKTSVAAGSHRIVGPSETKPNDCTICFAYKPASAATGGSTQPVGLFAGSVFELVYAHDHPTAGFRNAAIWRNSGNGAYVELKTTTTPSTSVFNRIGIRISGTTLTIWFNGVQENSLTITTSAIAGNPQFYMMGRSGVDTPGEHAEYAWWNAALSDQEMAAYGKGFSPALIRPANLVRYFPLVRNVYDWKGGAFTYGSGGEPAASPHLRTFYPTGPLYAQPPSGITHIATALPNTTDPTTSFTITIPATVQAGDDLILPFVSRNHTDANAHPTVTDNDTGGNAWTQTGFEASRRAQFWCKKATAGTAGKTITVSGCINSSIGVLKVFRGAHPTTPITNLAWDVNDTLHTSPGFTPTKAKSMICAIIYNYANDFVVTDFQFATDGLLTATEDHSTGGSDCSCIFGHDGPQTGETPNATGDLSWTESAGIACTSLVFALQPPDPPLSLILRHRLEGY